MIFIHLSRSTNPGSQSAADTFLFVVDFKANNWCARLHVLAELPKCPPQYDGRRCVVGQCANWSAWNQHAWRRRYGCLATAAAAAAVSDVVNNVDNRRLARRDNWGQLLDLATPLSRSYNLLDNIVISVGREPWRLRTMETWLRRVRHWGGNHLL